jgi:hypothetical protein
VLIGEVLEAVYDSHQGEPPDQVRETRVREYQARGITGVTAGSDLVIEPAVSIASGRPPSVDHRWLDAT